MLDFWGKMQDDFKLLAEASSKGSFEALRDFIKKNNPVPLAKKMAYKKMKAICDESLSGNNSNMLRPARGGPGDTIGSEAFNPNLKIETSFISPPDFNTK